MQQLAKFQTQSPVSPGAGFPVREQSPCVTYDRPAQGRGGSMRAHRIEIEKNGLAFADDDVGRLHVTVAQAKRSEREQQGGRFLNDFLCVARRSRGEKFQNVWPGHKFGDQVRRASQRTVSLLDQSDWPGGRNLVKPQPVRVCPRARCTSAAKRALHPVPDTLDVVPFDYELARIRRNFRNGARVAYLEQRAGEGGVWICEQSAQLRAVEASIVYSESVKGFFALESAALAKRLE